MDYLIRDDEDGTYHLGDGRWGPRAGAEHYAGLGEALRGIAEVDPDAVFRHLRAVPADEAEAAMAALEEADAMPSTQEGWARLALASADKAGLGAVDTLHVVRGVLEASLSMARGELEP